MTEEAHADSMLAPYRVLDLTDEKGWLCGKILGDFGADVIKIEPVGGDEGRNIGPFYQKEQQMEKSLYWFAFNTSKRGITLNLETTDGQEIFKKLVKAADFIIESFPPGYMEKLGLSYPELEKINSRIIMVSITPFGPTGPYKDYKISGIVAWALGGHLYRSDYKDRPPVGISHHPQAYLHAGGEAAAAALMALYSRRLTGEGQKIDVSIQECVVRTLMTAWWAQSKVFAKRGTHINQAGNVVHRKVLLPCKDGWVYWGWGGGPLGLLYNPPFMKWMEEEGMLDDYLKNMDWLQFNLELTNQETIDRIAEPTIRFLMTHTKQELFEGAIKRRVMLYPVSSAEDILQSRQLESRNFWQKVEHPELGTKITYPGAFVNASEAPPKIYRRAPLIGEHNNEIYENELGISKEKLKTLLKAKVI